MRPLATCLVAALLAGSGPAVAGPALTLNGVKIDGVTNQTFENCTVVVDERGNVHIYAKGYAVMAGAEASPPGATAAGGRTPAALGGTPDRLTRRYFLATEQRPPGAQFDLNVFINAKWIREVKASEQQVVVEITRYLRPGPNRITLAATKRVVNGERLATTSDVALRVVVGQGDMGGDRVLIDQPLVEMERTAAETDDKTEEFVIDAR